MSLCSNQGRSVCRLDVWMRRVGDNGRTSSLTRDTCGAFEGVEDQVSPFGYGRGEGVDAGHGDPEWICSKEKPQYDQIFQSLNPIDGKVTGAAAKTEMVKSKLPNSVLGKIWKLSDIDKDGFLDEEEFALAMHLIRVKIDGHDLPSELPPHLVPPSKRN
ncbi:unnamed protein product [Euphydryas editha]|uniref:Uncharacterized protein n=1 Tax=Euphydryas editha TaxID=104508 RepID=A0AAU9U7C3_EUPED|nr:unnamed protein product [Euphydryas editha]